MKTYLIDASVATRFLMTEDQDEGAKSVLRTFTEGNIDLTAPPLINYEVGNALRTAVSRQIIKLNEVSEVYERYLRLRLDRQHLSDEELGASLEFSARKGISLYDGLYIWGSKVSGLTLLTCDDKQIEAAKGTTDALHLRDYPIVR